ncbi:MAG: thiol reductant ABC exporter subunit CydC [Microbacteriaceae bacterium]|nr:thiol reductant ABC exporter subunit CydC [Microbacteriaceae bacterium]
MKDFTPEKIMRLSLPKLKVFAPSIFSGFLYGVMSVGLLSLSAWLITKASEMPPILHLMTVIVGVRAFALGRSVFRYLERISSHDVTFRAVGDLRARVYEKISPLAPAGLKGFGEGEVLTRLVRDVDQMQDYPLRVVQPAITSLLVGFGSIIFLFFFSWQAALLLGIGAVLGAALAIILTQVFYRQNEMRVAPLRGELEQSLHELLSNISVIISYEVTEFFTNRIADIDNKLRSAERLSAFGAALTSSIMLLITGLVVFFVIVIEQGLLGSGEIDGPEFALLVFAPLAVFEFLGTAVLITATRIRVKTAAERISRLVSAPIPKEIPVARISSSAQPEVPTITVGLRLHESFSDLHLKDFRVSWPGSNAVNTVAVPDLKLLKGERLLISGPSGAGKTTLAYGLLRFLEYQGSYQINSFEAKELPIAGIREVIGLCEQSPHIFDADLGSNIAFAKETVAEEEIWDALERVGLAQWAKERDGLSTWLGERGKLVSGGQAQRIALARALLANFPVIVLDEPTANVQIELGDALIEDIFRISSENAQTVILISHLDIDPQMVDCHIRL